METVRIHILSKFCSFFEFVGEIGVRALCRSWFYDPVPSEELKEYIEEQI